MQGIALLRHAPRVPPVKSRQPGQEGRGPPWGPGHAPFVVPGEPAANSQPRGQDSWQTISTITGRAVQPADVRLVVAVPAEEEGMAEAGSRALSTSTWYKSYSLRDPPRSHRNPIFSVSWGVRLSDLQGLSHGGRGLGGPGLL